MKLRDVIFWAHLTAGVTVGMVVLFMSVTGMMLAFRPQIVSIVEQGKYDSVAAQKNSPVRIFMKDVEGLHRWFGMQGKLKPVAKNIKGVCTIVFLGMIISGFYLWWPRKKIKLEPALRNKAWDWNRHNVIGFWSAPVLIIITVTGLLMTYLPKPNQAQAVNKIEVVKEERVKDTPQRKFRKLVRLIHTGEAAGIVGEIIVFMASGAAVMLVWTGLSMARRRFLSKGESYV